MNRKIEKITLYFWVNLLVALASGILIYLAFWELNIKELPHKHTLFEYGDNLNHIIAIYALRILSIASITIYVLAVNLKLIDSCWKVKKWLDDFIALWVAPFIILIMAQEHFILPILVIGWGLSITWVLPKSLNLEE